MEPLGLNRQNRYKHLKRAASDSAQPVPAYLPIQDPLQGQWLLLKGIPKVLQSICAEGGFHA